MYELFLTAAVKHGDLEMACAVLQGLTWMSARHNVYRVSFFAGQPQAKGLPNLRAVQQSPGRQSWSELSKELSRSSYIFQLAHEVFVDKDFGNGNAVDLNAVPGKVIWTGFPDPPREKDQLVTHRKKIDIQDQKNLLSMMATNGQGYKTELIQETYSFIRDNVEFVFSRYYQLPYSPGQSGPAASLPLWSDLKLVDPARKWMFSVKRNVMEDSQPEKMKEANKEIMDVKVELDTMFEFQAIDRRVLDTRIAAPPAIPGRGP
ncbi:mediator complex, subunit Med18 [Xylariales sp. AK1849]|nr:mediator complex, subunit Med18 [Xylariales sp. AK1849]